MAPTLPQATVSLALPPLAGILSVAAGDLQAVLDRAQPGDRLLLEPGSVHPGPITLPAKSGTGWITIGTRGFYPNPGTRVGPLDLPNMATILGGEGSIPAIQTEPGAHHYRFIGLEIAPGYDQFNTGLVRFGTGLESSLAELPHHLIVDRCFVRGDYVTGGKRGIAANGAFIGVVDSFLPNWFEGGMDTQAFAAWGGPGPFLIQNCYLEASGENLMFGGADTQIANLVPSDITIIGNDFVKPLAWRGSPNATVKNLFELKNARRVLVDRNTFSNCWADGQDGTAINLKSSNQDGTNPWAVTEHVTFTNNRIKSAAGGLKISTQPEYPAQTASHLLIRGNVWEDVNGASYGGAGIFVTLIGPLDDITIDGNWADTDGSVLILDGVPMTSVVFTNNSARHNLYGVKGSGAGIGSASLEAFCPGYVFTGNQLVGGAAFASLYPAGNTFPDSMPPMPVIGTTSTPTPTPLPKKRKGGRRA